jgi:hypothetical protein
MLSVLPAGVVPAWDQDQFSPGSRLNSEDFALDGGQAEQAI